MINWKSILSSFDDMPTLLEWLKLVEKALEESVLASVTAEQDADKANTKLIFKFEDGTQIDTGFFPTKGATGAKIIKTELIGQDACGGNIYKQTFDDGTTTTFTAPKGAKGEKGDTGADGVSITGIETVGGEVVGDETLTTLRAHYSNNTSDEFVVKAKNGSSGGKYYQHSIYSGVEGELEQISIYLINSSATPLTIETLSNENIKGFVNGTIWKDRDLILFPITHIEVKEGKFEVRYIGANFSDNYKLFTLIPFGDTPFDTVEEL